MNLHKWLTLKPGILFLNILLLQQLPLHHYHFDKVVAARQFSRDILEYFILRRFLIAVDLFKDIVKCFHFLGSLGDDHISQILIHVYGQTPQIDLGPGKTDALVVIDFVVGEFDGLYLGFRFHLDLAPHLLLLQLLKCLFVNAPLHSFGESRVDGLNGP